MVEHVDFVKQRMTCELNEEATEILHKGLFYTHGRDRNFRPICILRAAVLTTGKINYEEAMNAYFFVAAYTIKNLLVPGKAENWDSIIDLNNLAVSRLPLKFTIQFVKLMQAHLKCRSR